MFWLTGFAVAAAPLDTGSLELSLQPSAHPAGAESSLLIGSGVIARPFRGARRIGLRLDGDLGVLGPRPGASRGEDVPMTVAEADAGAMVPARLVAFPSEGAWRPPTRVTAATTAQVVLTAMRAHLGQTDLALDLGLGAGVVHTADEPRPARDTWSGHFPDPLRAQLHAAPTAAVGLRLGLTERLAAEARSRLLVWNEQWADHGSRVERPIWLGAGLTLAL